MARQGLYGTTQRLSKTKPKLQGGGGSSKKLLSYLDVQRTPCDDDVKHLVLSCFGPFLAGLASPFFHIIMLEVKFGTPKNLEEMSFQGRLRHLWSGAQDTNSLAKFPTTALTWGG
jgi:hypothetical protein